MKAYNLIFLLLVFLNYPLKAQDYVFKILTEDDRPIPILLVGKDQDTVKIKPNKEGEIKLSKEFLKRHKNTEFKVVFDPSFRALPNTYRRDLFYHKNSESCIYRNQVILNTIVQKDLKVLYIKYLIRDFVPPESIYKDSL